MYIYIYIYIYISSFNSISDTISNNTNHIHIITNTTYANASTVTNTGQTRRLCSAPAAPRWRVGRTPLSKGIAVTICMFIQSYAWTSPKLVFY